MPRPSDIEPFIDQIALIDLDNGMQLTTRIKGLTDDKTHILCDDIILFQINVVVPNPNLPPGPGNEPQQRIQSAKIGGPFCHSESPTPPIERSRVLFIHKPIDAIEKAYMQASSGIAVAGADTLGKLDEANRS